MKNIISQKDHIWAPRGGLYCKCKLKRVLGFVPSKFTPGLFTHKRRDIAFSLVIDDFTVKNTKREDAERLLKTI